MSSPRIINLLTILLCAAVTQAGSVSTAAPSIQYKTFDPVNPPPAMPHLTPPEAAVTVCGFGFSAQPAYDVITRDRGPDGNWAVTVAVRSVAVRVRLSIVIWLPKNASDKLKAHEEGHRKLDEMMYKKLSADAARAAAAAMEGHQFSGQGPTAAKAQADAINSMFQQAGQDYIKQTSEVNERINKTYDELTQHGTNDLLEADAMKQAIDRYEKDQSRE